MAEHAGAAPEAAVEKQSQDDGFVALARLLLRALGASPQRAALLSLAGGLLAVVGATAGMQIRLNIWTKAFYDSLSEKDIAGFGRQLLLYVFIAGALLALNVAQRWLSMTMKMKLREGLTRDLISEWLTPRRAFLIAGAGAIGVNPDQRIHEDANHLSDVSTDLGVGLLQAALLLVCFIGVLWGLSEGVVLSFRGARFSIPGYMVWAALTYAGAASLLSWRAGRRLIQLNAERYARESNLRFALVHANDHAEGIAVYRGENEESTQLNTQLDRLLVILRQVISVTTRLTWVTAGYGWFTIVAPIVVASPAYFAGNLTFGGLLMAVGAFDQVQQSLRWFVDNVGVIADWRATLLRVAAFRRALGAMDRIGGGGPRIELTVSPDNRLLLDDLTVMSRSGGITFDEAHVEIAAGEHVLIVGAPGVGKTSLFRAMAGLWTWGSGRIALPSDDRIMFMPKRPYIPDGSLREILAYPAQTEIFAAEQFDAALTRMGLSHLVGRLDESGRWDQNLTDAEQQSVAFARVLLHKPLWVIVDSAIDSLSLVSRKALFDIFSEELSASTLVNIAGSQGADPFFRRILCLTRKPQRESLAQRRAAG
ncbi:ABC transporter ATP-binding protein/permease [Rhodoblastus acidophilus]|uniref:ABC transporter ATP-binding protein/permease n=1 Tax=Candidatus Rhodoblastus alkanivorans TaxID=2954117 RepID=A0ABS9Z5K5_9HYPH|nr:ABC transporter ATP-binding protein/permease [Candidatus Rhodoblastus alkanivorans]MCI4678419.1 ABC transporter ATP-binding protein/permease [Candidatus Rhodoblastus alkanivorans]MCI4682908.1 ABC transporter ATP-binding protein/permease [Candidatus Rhodoblastus alkanivorans]MDI4640218.1 ABC transporter ATP-binding protein/permease [Rhodoblastus acidophilus]